MTLRELKSTEITSVTGGGKSIVQLIEEAFPGGEWVGGSYYPNGVPETPPGDYTL